MKNVLTLGLLTACLLITACSGKSGNDVIVINGSTDMANGHIRLNNDHVVLRVDGSPDATISANGDLQIDQQSVNINDAQRQLLQSYYQNAFAIRTDGIATGKAGAAVGAQALKSVATRLASGDPDKIQQDVDAKAKLVKEAARKICQDISGIQAVQNQLTPQLPAFKPYGNIMGAGDAKDCMDGTKD
ncbi:DUF2884 family protein [Dyella lipolytica]|uniref:DUF2884 family protein n=1 Tax=Dyella lipolytica TaxID=1867835 RepID=A0ABW8J0K9_9GAMM|nr:DUF2884 family protein [Dyella lipolytica]